MISDVLADAAEEIRSYLEDPAFRGVYTGEAREIIGSALVAMYAARDFLDTPPAIGTVGASCGGASAPAEYREGDTVATLARRIRDWRCTYPGAAWGFTDTEAARMMILTNTGCVS